MIFLAFIKSLEAQGWDADTQLEHPELTMGLPLEDLDATPEMRDDIMKQQMKESAESKRALIVKVSHVGGHKYAGNCIVSPTFLSARIPSYLRVLHYPGTPKAILILIQTEAWFLTVSQSSVS